MVRHHKRAIDRLVGIRSGEIRSYLRMIVARDPSTARTRHDMYKTARIDNLMHGYV